MEELQLQVALDGFFAAQPFYPCCLLIHPDVRHLDRVSKHLTTQYGWTTLSIGTLLSEALREVVPARRPNDVVGLIKDAVHQNVPGPLLCTDIDLMFTPTLRIDPLRILREASRIVPMIVTWPGSYFDHTVTYATTQHAHYRMWPKPELCTTCIICL